MVRKQHKTSSQRLNTYVFIVLVIAIVVVLNLLGNYVNFRLDLTEDSRYTLGESTEHLLENLDEQVYVSCYLDGDLPAGFQELKEAIHEMLDEFRAQSGVDIDYEFIDPYEIAQGKERSDLFTQLAGRGLKSFELQDTRDDEIVRKIVWPSAFVSIGEREVPVSFLREQMGMSSDLVLHNSVMGVEYELANAISSLVQSHKKRIAVVGGHGEVPSNRLSEIARELSLKYDIERIDITQYKVGKLEQFDAAIIAGPDSTYSNADLYRIDHYIMNGGKVLWFLESLVATMDSLRTQNYTTTLDYNLNLRDLLFRYGVRVNLDLVQDYNSHTIPVMAGEGGTVNRKWPYYPLVTPTSDHPIVKNLGLIWFQFPNSIDTLPAPGINKTILLKSSANSRIVHHPHRIMLQLTQMNLNPSLFSNGEQNLAVLLEGKFTSFFKNKLTKQTLANPDYGVFVDESPETKMVVVSDVDIIANGVNPLNGDSYPLGFDRYTGKSFGNKSFVLNSVDYLLDESGLFQLRSKDFKLRMLQQGRAKDERAYWQMINLVVPLVLLVLAGLLFNFLRKRRFTK